MSDECYSTLPLTSGCTRCFSPALKQLPVYLFHIDVSGTAMLQQDAHKDVIGLKGAKCRRRKYGPLETKHTVTSVVFLHNDNMLATSGAPPFSPLIADALMGSQCHCFLGSMHRQLVKKKLELGRFWGVQM